jgi:hypothetical protein
MTRLTRLALGAGLIAMLAGSAACATTINQVLADPSKYKDHEVTISGDVTESFSALNRGVYRVHDKTGDLWVVSEHGVPRKGARVSVKGTIRDGFNLGSFGNVLGNLPAGVGSGLVLVEASHKAS